MHLLGLVSHGGVHSHIDHVQALLRFAPEKTWIHAFTDGRDVSPTSAVRDLAELPLDRIATVVGRYYAMDRDNRDERTEKAFDAIVDGSLATTVASDRCSTRSRRATTPASPTSSSSRSCVEGTPRLRAGRHRDLLQLPARPRPAADAAAARRRLRRDDDDALLVRARRPVVFGEQDVANTLAEVLADQRPAAAARRRDGEVRPRDLLLQRRPRGGVARRDADPRPEPARRAELRPEARDVGRRGRRPRRRRGGRRLQLLRRQLREPRHGRAHGRHPGGRSRQSRRPTPRSGGSSSG